MAAMTRDRRAGFTLIEMMIVVVVMGLAMMIAVPRFRASSKTKARMAATMLTSDLELARTKAMAHRAQVRVVFNTATNEYTGYLDFNRDGVISESTAERDSLHAFGTRQLANSAVFGRNGQADITDFTGAGNITFPIAADQLRRPGPHHPLRHPGRRVRETGRRYGRRGRGHGLRRRRHPALDL